MGLPKAITSEERFKRQAAAQAKLWRMGRVRWMLEEHQLAMVEALNQPNVEIFYADLTRRGGKTFGMVVDAIEFCMNNKGERVRYATAFLSDLIEFILPTFEAVLETCPEDMRPKYKATNKTYTFPNGSVIKLVGLDKNPNGLRGNNVFRIYLDECGFISNLEYVHKSVIVPASARRKKQKTKPVKVICFSTPPEDATEHYAYQLKTKAQLEKNGMYFCRTLDEIDAIDDEEKARLIHESGGRESVTVRREYYCEWIVDQERAVCPTFDEVSHVRLFDVPMAEEAPDYVNWEFVADIGGVRDLTVGLSGYYDHDTGKVYIWDERWYAAHTPTTEHVVGFKELRFKDMPCFMDGAGIARVDYAAIHKFDVALPPKDEFDAGLLLMRNAFFKDQVVIHERCKLLRATLAGGLLNRTRTDYNRTETLGHCDAAAALIYLLRTIDKVSDNRPKPKAEDVYYGTQVVAQRKRKNVKGLGWTSQ